MTEEGRGAGLGGWQGEEVGFYPERDGNHWMVISCVVTVSDLYFNKIPLWREGSDSGSLLETEQERLTQDLVEQGSR